MGKKIVCVFILCFSMFIVSCSLTDPDYINDSLTDATAYILAATGDIELSDTATVTVSRSTADGSTSDTPIVFTLTGTSSDTTQETIADALSDLDGTLAGDALGVFESIIWVFTASIAAEGYEVDFTTAPSYSSSTFTDGVATITVTAGDGETTSVYYIEVTAVTGS